MKNLSIFAALTGLLFGLPAVSDAAYPTYPSYQMGRSNGVVSGVMSNGMMQNTMVPNGMVSNGMGQYLPSANSRIVGQTGSGVYNQYRNAAAAQPTRITGALPHVGSSNTTAGRSYYQPSDYDRLADSGLYVGLSVGYTASLIGGMSADYTGEQNSFYVPGAFEEAGYHSDTVIPLQLSVGAAINNNIRVDFSYLRYSGLAYPTMVRTSDGMGGLIDATVDGGAITSNTTMLNLYYNIDSYTGYLAGGSMRPYVGVGVGLSLNTVADYVVYDNTFYSEMDPIGAGPGDLTGISDVYAYHNGGTMEQLAFMLEGGLTTELDGGIKLDFFVRYANLGKVRTSGSIIVSQTEWLGDGAGGEYEAPYDSVFHYTNWYESGRLGMVDLGIRMRLQF